MSVRPLPVGLLEGTTLETIYQQPEEAMLYRVVSAPAELREMQHGFNPWIDLGRKTLRYRVKDVLAWLDNRRRDVERRRPPGS